MSAIALPRLIRIGAGVLEETGQTLDQVGLQHPVVVTDKYILQTGAVARLEGSLNRFGIKARIFADAIPQPNTDCVDAVVGFVGQGVCDSVIGFGGGSPIDAAKAAAVLSQRGGQMRALRAPHEENSPGLPIIGSSSFLVQIDYRNG
jgi:alcohol dehydrogenase class IV